MGKRLAWLRYRPPLRPASAPLAAPAPSSLEVPRPEAALPGEEVTQQLASLSKLRGLPGRNPPIGDPNTVPSEVHDALPLCVLSLGYRVAATPHKAGALLGERGLDGSAPERAGRTAQSSLAGSPVHRPCEIRWRWPMKTKTAGPRSPPLDGQVSVRERGPHVATPEAAAALKALRGDVGRT
jgi:hypothetical protein